MKYLATLSEALENWKAAIISLVFLAISFTGMMTGQPLLEGMAWVSVLLSGFPLAYEALESLVEDKRITSGLLITMAIIASLIIGECFAAGEIAVIMSIGELLEHGTLSRAKRGIKRLLSLSPTRGRKIEGEHEAMIDAVDIRKGDLLRVHPGESIPADGLIESGCTTVEQSILTGESLPVERAQGDLVYAGTMNGDGCIDIRATRDGSDSSLQRMIRLVQEAGEKQAPIQREADRWAQWIVPASLTIALLGYIILRLLGYGQGDAMLRAVTVLVVFCPCALALATPTSIMAAIGQATKKGVIIKSGEALESLALVDTLAFDKTGTLTVGHPTVASLHAYGDTTEQDLCRLAGVLERRSNHPLARAVAACAGDAKADVRDFRSLPGRGVRGTVDGRELLCGSETCMQEAGILLTEEQKNDLHHLRKQGMATVLLAEGSRLLGLMGMQDKAREEAARVLSDLPGIRKVLMTGDNGRAAAHFASDLPLDAIHADLLPGEKADLVATLQKEGKRVAMVGDGVNDAPALKQAEVGIAMSHLGADIATEAADVSLMNDDLTRLPYLMRLSRATLKCIRFNIGASLVINIAAVALSLAGVLNPITGALVHNAGSLLVILNAALLFDRKFD